MTILFEKSVKLGGFIAKMKIQKVPPNKNRPDGFKVNFILLRLEDFKQILLVDNHAPHGYHLHSNPDDPKEREAINANDPYEALDFFIKKAKEMTNEK